MKKLALLRIVLILSLIFFTFCAKKPSAPEPGSAKVDDILNLIPKDIHGILFIDFHKAMTTEFFENSLKKEKIYEKYQEFVEETGIDPKKDIYFIAVGLKKFHAEQEKEEGVFLLNLKCEKETLLAKIKEKEEVELKEEDYYGITVYTVEEDVEKKAGAFLDDSNIIIGREEVVKDVIDIYQRKAENVSKNKELASLIKQTNKRALFWGSIIFPPEVMKKFSDKNPMLKTLGILEAATFYFDYKNKNLSSEIKILTSDEAKNKQIMDFFQGIKAFGAMAAAEKPEIEELLNKIEITSGPDNVTIYASIPEELFNKIRDLMEEEK